MIFTQLTQTSFCVMSQKPVNFSRKQGELTNGKFRMTSPQFSRKSDPNVFVEDVIGNQEQARPVSDHFASSVVTGHHLREPRPGSLLGRNAKWNRKYPEFSNL